MSPYCETKQKLAWFLTKSQHACAGFLFVHPESRSLHSGQYHAGNKFINLTSSWRSRTINKTISAEIRICTSRISAKILTLPFLHYK